MDYKNDNRTPRDRITGEFLSELLFSEQNGECDCGRDNVSVGSVPVKRNSAQNNTVYQRTRNICRSPANYVEITGNYSLAMAYVPMQRFGDLFEVEDGFCQGTIFKDLRFPFYPTPCRKVGD